MTTPDRDRHRLLVGRTDATEDADDLDAVYRYRIQRREPSGDWTTIDTATSADYVAVHRLGHQRWRELIGPVFTEVEPLGPTDQGAPGGPGQLSTAYGRRFTRLLTDGQYHGVVDIECYTINGGPDDDRPEPVLTMLMSFTICTDPTDPGGTEVQCYTTHRTFLPYTVGEPAPGDAEAYKLCAEFDHDDLVWDGAPPTL